ncbi:bifunctional riboflavin kinase/FAD synthetase [Persicimonas caeni]|uniref:Riboflavin biosynthesis protein n=1 Tax=Persicimonas caeni TaxID=2292766 RepID=A0A4Y6PWN1_PERCE|nr:bifunctional riboflavin kinase/FAD synthetase [Persicimonas caeni]QDG52734.1 bifunctional riboflavin kinase/FAD synthetase [Persicimonas caeni]QED33956.1 bifunctional riboflavin kinase/FAD synthetase [Persicimonas caeni]
MYQHTVYRSLEEASAGLNHPVVTIGNFDGVHIGHQAIFQRVRQLADERSVPAVALTFAPHPVRYFRKDAPPFRLTTNSQKAALIGQYGLDATVALAFDDELAGLTPADFVEQVLVDGLDATYVVVGEDFAFGKGRAGTTADLERLCEERGIETEIAKHVTLDGEPVSSTRVRRELAAAHMEEIVRLLGRPYRILGEVVRGEQRGRKLGFPTANISPANPLLPPHGVYATTLHVADLPALHSITNVGVRPTFGASEVTVECFVLSHGTDEVDLDLYGESVELDFWKFVREEKKFDSPKDLVAQIQRDVAEVRRFFKL